MKTNQDSPALTAWPPRLDALIQSAEDAFSRGDFCLFLQFADKPQDWAITEVELARVLVREEERWTKYVEDHWSVLGYGLDDEAPSLAQLERMSPEEREEYDRFTAWTRPLAPILADYQTALVEPATLISFPTYTSRSPGLDFSTAHEVKALTDHCGGVPTFHSLEDYP